MTIAEALIEGAQTTVVGLATVFAVLILLMLVLYILKLIFYKEPKTVKETAPVPTEVKVEEKNIVDEKELIAVLTAAVAASLNTSTYNLQIKSYRRVESKNSAWNKAGIRETINNRF